MTHFHWKLVMASQISKYKQVQVDTGDTTPIKQPVRRVPFVFRDKIAAMVDEMESLGVI